MFNLILDTKIFDYFSIEGGGLGEKRPQPFRITLASLNVLVHKSIFSEMALAGIGLIDIKMCASFYKKTYGAEFSVHSVKKNFGGKFEPYHLIYYLHTLFTQLTFKTEKNIRSEAKSKLFFRTLTRILRMELCTSPNAYVWSGISKTVL